MKSHPRLEQQAFRAGLRTKHLGRSSVIVDRCASTNDLAARFATEGAAHGFTAIADEQTAGRGRLGRTWFSPRGGIWMTVLLRPPFIPNPWNSLPLVGALAIARSLHSGPNLTVKAKVRWPNDIVVDNRKLGGVLVEARSKGNQVNHALVGMGINANFPIRSLGKVRGTSTTLLELLGSEIPRENLICSILSEMEHLNELLLAQETGSLLNLLRGSECSRGSKLRIRQQENEMIGIFDDYETLTKVRIVFPDGDFKILDTGLVDSAEYLT